MLPVDGSTLWSVADRYVTDRERAATQQATIGAIGPILVEVLERYRIDTMLRIAHFLAQVCTECADFTETEEQPDDPHAYGKYDGRHDLGNTEPGDGYRFRGRGLIQITGRANYALFGEKAGLDLLVHPELASQPCHALALACEYWTAHGLNDLADGDFPCAITRRINGGLNGLSSRIGHLARARTQLLPMARQLGAATEPLDGPVLSSGATSSCIYDLQHLLTLAGHPVTLDGQFGPGTASALRAFQVANGLPATGIADAGSWKALRAKDP